MNVCPALVLIPVLCFAGAVRAAEEPVAAPLQVAQAATVDTADAPASRESLPVHGTLRGVLAAADRGPAALRQYILITQPIYHYRFEDFAKAEWYR